MGLIKDIKDIECNSKGFLQKHDIIQDRYGCLYMYIDSNKDLKSLIPKTSIPNPSKSNPIFLDISNVLENDRDYMFVEYFNDDLTYIYDLTYISHTFRGWDIMRIYRPKIEIIDPELKRHIKTEKLINLSEILSGKYGDYELIWERAE